MQPQNDPSTLCAECGEPAVEAYTFVGHTEMLCAAHLDRMKVQDAYESQLVHFYTLSSDGQCNEALACLDEIWQANRDRDHDGWLARSLAADRALILFNAARYEEAEQAYNAEAQLGFEDDGYRMVHALGAARNLDALGRTQEAVYLLEKSLSYAQPKHMWSAFGVLAYLLDLSEKLGQPIDPKWQAVAEAGAKARGVELPDWKAKGSSLGEAIREAAAAAHALDEEKEAARKASLPKKSPTKKKAPAKKPSRPARR